VATDLVIEERPVDDPDLARLLAAAYDELVGRYGAEGRSQVKPNARYLVVLEDEVAVGCGALQAFEPGTDHAGDGEVKRMFVAPEARGRGFARVLLACLEHVAREAGHPTLRLTTGDLQPAAIALYESSGYRRTDPWGKYIEQPGTNCYAKTL